MVFCTIAQKSIEISFLQLVSALNYYDHALLLDPRHMWYTPSLRAQVNAISFIAYCHHARFCAEVFSSFENLKKKKEKLYILGKLVRVTRITVLNSHSICLESVHTTLLF
jgi:hypothetical protein